MTRLHVVAGVVLAATLSVTALAPAGAVPHQGAAAERSGAYRVTAELDTTAPLEGSTVEIAGRVRPHAPGARVALQLKYVGKKHWRTVDQSRLAADSRYTFTQPVDDLRARRYRVVKPAGPDHAGGQATTPRVTVHRWRDLSSLGLPVGDVGMEVADATINGVVYPHSLRQQSGSPNGGSVTYDLVAGCTAFRATAGLDDSSSANGSATMTVHTDIELRYEGSLTNTTSAPVTFDLAGASRLEVTVIAAAGGRGVLGSPQLLCTS